MRIPFKTLALATMLTMTVTGCQKEQINSIGNNYPELGVIGYYENIVDGHTIVIINNGCLNLALMEQDIHRLVLEGYTVVVQHNKTIGTKEVLTYTTSSWDDAYAWCQHKEKEGYTVSITQDKDTGVYICTAIK